MTSQTTQPGERESSDAARSGRSTRGTDTRRRNRAAAAITGGALLLYGITRRSVRGIAAAIAGGWLLSRAVRRSESAGGSGNWTAQRDQSPTGAPRDAPDVQRSITVERPAEELYDRWRDPETHEQIWAHFAEVEQVGEDRQHWALTGPGDVTVEWDAEVVAAEPGEFLRWKSLPGARVPNEGSVRFKSRADGEETEVTLHLRFDPPGGRVGTALLERLDLLPDAAAGTALRRFKSLVETGEIPTLERNPSARGEGDLL
ncbi:SRPBCC family protein [Halosimplex amylolyticum]|uniref:SRPBCC family protein n=1 Tax=Halosimplex amylolyticum TaxID=3396616 RepID=UPI003F566AEB